MTACPAPAARPAVARVGRVQLLAHCAALRTALRRALAPAGGTLSLSGPAGVDGGPVAGAARPDAVVLDTELPGLDGLDLLRQIASGDPDLPVVVVAPDTPENRALRAEALRSGAAGFVLRPETERPLALKPVAEEILSFIGAAPRGKPRSPADRASSPRGLKDPTPAQPQVPADRTSRSVPYTHRALARERPAPPARPARRQTIPPQVVVVASSTGGPQALIDTFQGIAPGALSVPVLVVQHMPAAFTPILAEHLTRATAWRAVEATNDERLTAGEIRIAPGGHHMIVAGQGADRRLKLTSDPPVNFCRPAADVLFTSVAASFGRAVLAVILTGMGNDGCEGAKVIAAAGGAVIAQDKETSVVWGMPGAAVNAGVVNRVLPLKEVPGAMQSAMKGVL